MIILTIQSEQCDTLNIMRTVVSRTISTTCGNAVEVHCYINDIKCGYL